MPITSIKRRGNRRSVNNPEGGTASTTETGTVAVSFSDKPQISNQSFKYPGTPPIQKIPSIQAVLETPSVKPVSEPPKQELVPESATTQEAVNEPKPAATEMAAEEKVQEPQEKEPEVFETCWKQLFEELFSNNPMIYHPLKEKIPTLEDGVIKVEVLNDFQKDQYEMRKRAVLEYWRNHFTTNVDDLEIVVNENMEMKKIIYSSEDKMKNLEEQNPEIRDFLQVLNFRVKD